MKYFDEDGNIRSALLDEEAKLTADSWVVYLKEKDGSIKKDRRGKPMTNNTKTLSSAQLRRFFNDFKQLEK